MLLLGLGHCHGLEFGKSVLEEPVSTRPPRLSPIVGLLRRRRHRYYSAVQLGFLCCVPQEHAAFSFVELYGLFVRGSPTGGMDGVPSGERALHKRHTVPGVA